MYKRQPFITSTLQQEASRKLNMTPRRTMSIAQELYEGIELGEYGLTGLITYMRTDSLRLADEATAAAAGFLSLIHICATKSLLPRGQGQLRDRRNRSCGFRCGFP